MSAAGCVYLEQVEQGTWLDSYCSTTCFSSAVERFCPFLKETELWPTVWKVIYAVRPKKTSFFFWGGDFKPEAKLERWNREQRRWWNQKGCLGCEKTTEPSQCWPWRTSIWKAAPFMVLLRSIHFIWIGPRFCRARQEKKDKRREKRMIDRRKNREKGRERGDLERLEFIQKQIFN